MTDLQQYLSENNLFDLAALRAHSALNSVNMITSPRFPNLVMLHYSREAQTEKNWNTFSRMCRGLILDMKNKCVLARPFDKFFNIDEQPETKLPKLTQYKDFSVSEKLDGSMLILFKDSETGQFHFTTKGSFESDHGKYATLIMPESLKSDILVKTFTFIFELVTYRKDLRANLVIDYQKKGYPEGVYLIGVRNKISGTLASFKKVREFAEIYNLPVFKTYSYSSLDEMVEKAKALPVLEEGFVIHFPGQNLLVKLKGEDYKRAHRFISKLSPTYLLEGLMYNSSEDLIELAPEEYKEDVIKQLDTFRDQKLLLKAWLEKRFEEAPKDSGRKEFAIWVNQNLEGGVRGFMFQLYDKKSLPDWKLYKNIGDQQGLNPRILYEKTK